jgi:hypothetical protein
VALNKTEVTYCVRGCNPDDSVDKLPQWLTLSVLRINRRDGERSASRAIRSRNICLSVWKPWSSSNVGGRRDLMRCPTFQTDRNLFRSSAVSVGFSSGKK